jgi:hypothetical protein
MQGNKRQRGEMRTRQEARQTMARWQQPARDVHKKIKNKKRQQQQANWFLNSYFGH